MVLATNVAKPRKKVAFSEVHRVVAFCFVIVGQCFRQVAHAPQDNSEPNTPPTSGQGISKPEGPLLPEADFHVGESNPPPPRRLLPCSHQLGVYGFHGKSGQKGQNVAKSGLKVPQMDRKWAKVAKQPPSKLGWLSFLLV